MTSFECSIICNVDGCQEYVGAPSAYESAADAIVAAEVKARRLGWIVSTFNTDTVHICHRHAGAHFHQNPPLK